MVLSKIRGKQTMLALFFVGSVIHMVAFLVVLVRYVEHLDTTDRTKDDDNEIRELIFTETI